MKLSQSIFKNNSLGRLKFINCLHDFKNIAKQYDAYDEEGEETAEDIDTITWNAFFPKMTMQFG